MTSSLYSKLLLLSFSIILFACGGGASNKVSNQTPPVTQEIKFSVSIAGDGKIVIEALSAECSDQCTYDLSSSQELLLTAQASDNAKFMGWDADSCETDDTCLLNVSQDTQINAQFEAVENTAEVTVNVYGDGTIMIDEFEPPCSTSCVYELSVGDSIAMKATAESGNTFLNWSGLCQERDNPCTFTVQDNTNIDAFFTPTSGNTFTIQEPAGISSTNIPIQIARPFAKGEITNYPVVRIPGLNIVTQATIKQRHDDGSVKHAIINFVLDQLQANEELLAFIEDGSAPSGDSLNKADMLGSNFNFDASQEYTFTNGKVANVSARTMLEQDHYMKWIDGPVATTLILVDHSSNRIFDVGADTHRSIRPSFHVTFWKDINKYTVRFISEITNSEALQDQIYDIKLFLGQDQSEVYSKNAVPHQARTRWTNRTASYDSPILNINHNLNYLKNTLSVPNFDTDISILESTIERDWSTWQQVDKDIYDKGFWQPAMATGGGRKDIGIYPAWATKWLYSGDWRYHEIALKQSELSGAWPMHIREGRAGLYFDMNNSVDAQGKVVSISTGARPTHWADRPEWHEIDEKDKIYYVDATSNPRANPEAITAWRPDSAHHPDIASPQYLLTGDYYFLEQMLFSAAYVTSNNNAKGFKSTLGRGPTGSEGTLYSGEIRGQAWGFRTRVHTYDILPDDAPEKAYFDRLNKNAITSWEALFDVPASYNSYNENIDFFNRPELYEFVRTNVKPTKFKVTGESSIIGLWDEGITATSYVRSDRVNTSEVSRAMAPWMQNFAIISLGRAKELGYKTENLLDYSGKMLTELFAENDNRGHLLAAYILPTTDLENNWLKSWDTTYSMYTASYNDEVRNYVLNRSELEHGYDSIAMTAASYLVSSENDSLNDELLWQYILTNISTKTQHEENPKWLTKPRAF